jgi:hypothetical protein
MTATEHPRESVAWAIGVLQDPAAPVGRKMAARQTLGAIADAAEQLAGAVDLLREAEPFVVWPPGTPLEARERWASAVASLARGQ